MANSDTGSDDECNEAVENCYICRFNAKNFGRLMKFLPQPFCLNICKMNACNRCELFLEMDDIGHRIDKLQEKRRITTGSGDKRRIRDQIMNLEEKGSKINDEIEKITEKTIHIYNKYF